MAHFRKVPNRCKKSHKHLLHKPSYSQFCSKCRCHGNGGRSGKNATLSSRWPILEKPPIGAKSRKNLLRNPSYTQFRPEFRSHGNGNRSRKNAPQKPFYSRKNLAKNLVRKQKYRLFFPKFRCHENGGQSEKNATGSIRWPISKIPYRRKNFAKICYASQIIAHFVPNFVPVATGVGRGK